MRLDETGEFRAAVLAAADSLDLDERFVEKDYWVTTILRIIARELGDKTIFKGGTSLSKGWALIERFSEDIDLFVDPQAWDPSLTARAASTRRSARSGTLWPHTPPSPIWRPRSG